MRALSVVVLVVLLAGCSRSATTTASASGKLPVITTFSVLASLTRSIGGDRVDVSSLVPVGASPETYAPSPVDVERLHDARVLVRNGGGLETWLDRTIANARNPQIEVVTGFDSAAAIDDNPHQWMSPRLARGYVRKIAAALTTADPAGRETYAKNLGAFERDLDALDARTREKIARIPANARTMIVFHDAWAYYNREFGLKTLGVVEISPGQEPSPTNLARLTDLARAHHVKALFTEPEYSPKLIDTISHAAGGVPVVTLYDDSVGSQPQTGSYTSLIDFDTDAIVKALS